MNPRLRLVLVGLLALAGPAAMAQSTLRPGLWEETLDADSSLAQMQARMQQRLASMTPEQRAAMEKAMAGGGLAVGGAPHTLRVCLTKEHLDRGLHPEGDGRCARTHVSTSGNVTSFDFACQTPNGEVKGDGAFTQISDSAFKVRWTANVTHGNGPAKRVDNGLTARFLSPDCGDVKPIPLPAGQ